MDLFFKESLMNQQDEISVHNSGLVLDRLTVALMKMNDHHEAKESDQKRKEKFQGKNFNFSHDSSSKTPKRGYFSDTFGLLYRIVLFDIDCGAVEATKSCCRHFGQHKI
jgi:hypothetical protein